MLVFPSFNVILIIFSYRKPTGAGSSDQQVATASDPNMKTPTVLPHSGDTFTNEYLSRGGTSGFDHSVAPASIPA